MSKPATPSESRSPAQSTEGGVSIAGRGSFATLQAAIDAARPGDELLVTAATYNEALRIEKSLTIRAQSQQAQPILTALDEAVVTIVGTASVTLQGLILKPTTVDIDPTTAKDAITVNPEDRSGESTDQATLNVADCRILGSIDCRFTILNVQNCVFNGPAHANADGDPILKDYGIRVRKGELKITGTMFSHFYKAINAYCRLEAVKVTMKNCNGGICCGFEEVNITDVECEVPGIAIMILNSKAIISNATLTNRRHGGCAFNVSNSQVEISGTVMKGFFDGIHASQESSVIATDCEISECGTGINAIRSLVEINESTISGCRVGLRFGTGGNITASHCRLRNNERESWRSKETS